MEMTKMLLPSVPSMPAKIHSTDKYIYCRNVGWVKDYHTYKRILLKLLERENYRQLLQTNLAPNYESQWVACPSANEEFRHYSDVISVAKEEKRIKLCQPLLQSKPETEPELVQEPKLESVLKPEPEPELKLKLESKPGSKPKSNPEPEAKSKQETRTKLKLKLNWTPLELAEQDWKRDLARESEPNPVPEVNWDSDDDFVTSSEMIRLYISDSENDMISKHQPNTQKLDFKARIKKLRKNRYFMSHKSANRMLSSAILYGNVNLENHNGMFRLQRGIQTSILPNRSLLKSQQNVNNVPTKLSPKNGCRPSLLDNQKKFCDQNQDYPEKISTSYNQPIKEENQDVEMKQPLHRDDLFKTVTDAEEELPIFRHDQINVSEKLSEYISEGASMISRCSLKTEGTNQRVKRRWRKNEESQRQSDIKRNTLSDHCYHLNEPRSNERLGLPDSDDEEIDVVSLGKQATYSNFVGTQQNKVAKPVANADNISTLRRPRGRPPGPNSAKRKRDAQANQSSPKRVRKNQRTNRRQNNARQNNTQQYENHAENENNQKRKIHNTMERERRINLRKNFNALKACIPEIGHNQKVSKVSILKHARNYIEELRELEKAQKRNIELRKRLGELVGKNKMLNNIRHNKN